MIEKIKKLFKKEIKFTVAYVHVLFIAICWWIAALFSMLNYYK